MKITSLYLILGLVLTNLVVGCNSSPSLERYFVDSKENPNFLSLDIPASMLNAMEGELSKEEQEAYNSLKKLNILAFRLTPSNKESFEIEKKKVQKILENDQYKNLIKLSDREMRGNLSFVGTEDAIDELIAFGYKNDMGFIVVRGLADDMNLKKAMILSKVINPNEKSLSSLGQLKDFFEK